MAIPASASLPAAPARPSWPLARTATIVTALWAVPAVVALGQISIEQTLAGAAVDWRAALWTTLPNWVLWALMTPAVVALAARLEPGRAAPWRIAAGLAAGGALALAVHALGNVAAFRLAGLPSDWTWGTFETHYALRAPVNVFAFGFVVVATWGLRAVGRVRERQAYEARLEAELARAELAALRGKVRPHFLFNALHAVGATVRTGDADGAVTLLAQLGDLLRASLESDGATEVPLARELDVVRATLAIEHARIGDRLTVTLDVDDAVRAARVPPWSVQPLVENAVKHGVASHTDPAQITIRARADGGRLVVTVEDDGPGPGAAATPGTGVGLANTRARLDALYGAAADLTLAARPGGGAVATLALPLS